MILVVIVTAVWCNPTPHPGRMQPPIPRVLLSGYAHVPSIDGIQYAPSFANGKPRVEGADADGNVVMLAAIPQTIMSALGSTLFNDRGQINLYRVLSFSTRHNAYQRDGRMIGAQLYLGEEKADLSRAAAQYFLHNY